MTTEALPSASVVAAPSAGSTRVPSELEMATSRPEMGSPPRVTCTVAVTSPSLPTARSEEISM